MANISLQKSVRTCRVDTGWANKMQSDRFLNSCQTLCPVWSGMDSYGRFVCQDSFKTETDGCRSASDRIAVENYQRPQYFEYVNLDGFGVNGNLYNYDAGVRATGLDDIHKIAGNPGIDYGANIAPRCKDSTYGSYERAMHNEQCGDKCYPDMGMVKASACKCGPSDKDYYGDGNPYGSDWQVPNRGMTVGVVKKTM